MLIADVVSDVRRSLRFRRAERRARQARRGLGPRILVIGTCQGAAVGEAMKLMLPEADVTILSAFDLTRRFSRFADLVAEARAHDVIFSSVYLPRFRDGGGLAALAAASGVIVIPTVVFAAFHPDQVRVGMDASRPEHGGFLGPMGHAHSALGLFGYLEGLGLDRTLRLFDERVYRAVGYLGMWDDAVAGLRALGADVGYDFDADLVRWSRRGCFMHSDNHPKSFVVADIARGLLGKAGIAHDPCDLDSYLDDTLLGGGSWPVYPPIAEHYGILGNTLFLKVATPGTGPARTMTPRAFLEASFAGYARRPQQQLTCERVETWRGEPEIRDLLLHRAGMKPEA